MGLGILMSKVINIPDVLPYPKLYQLKDIPEFKNKFCYILKSFPDNGLSVLILRDKGDICVRMGDFSGNIIDLNQPNDYVKQVSGFLSKIVTTMRCIAIPKAIFYFSNDNGVARLVDMRLNTNKFCGPGYLYDFFGKQDIPVQVRIGEPIILDDTVISDLLCHQNAYKDNCVIKPSAFKTIIREDQIVPLYGVTS
jgi:hypothetical protein